MKQRTKVIAGAAGVVGVIALGVVLRVSVAEDGPDWHPWEGPTITRDLDSIKQDTLRVLVLRDPLIWEERSRATTGFAFELLERFARKAKLKLKTIPFDNPDSLLVALWRGAGDLGAVGLDRDDWSGHFSVTKPFTTVQPLVVTRRKEVRPHDSVATMGAVIDHVVCASGSPFADPAYEFHRALRLPVTQAGSTTEDDLLVDVVIGKLEAAIISDLRAGHEAERFPILDFSAPMGPARELGFVVRSTSPRLLAALNDWLEEKSTGQARDMLLRSYADPIPVSGALRSRRIKGLRRDSISPFDDEFKRHAATTGWDWRLLAAVAWKETRFDSTVTSHRGASGIMQFMPATAAGMGLDSSSHMGDHINAAARYLSRLDMLWLRQVPDKEQRLRFVLASYNAGPGHVIDAQRLADQLGLDPSWWEGNVERAVLLLAKPEFFTRPEMKNGYCKGHQVFLYVRGVLAVHRQLKGK